MVERRSIHWGVLVLALSLPLLGPVGCTSSQSQFMGSGQPDAPGPSSGESLGTAAKQVGLFIAGAVLLVGGLLILLWVWSVEDDDDDEYWPGPPPPY